LKRSDVRRVGGKLVGCLGLLALLLGQRATGCYAQGGGAAAGLGAIGMGAIGMAGMEQPPLPGVCTERDRFGVWDNAHHIDRYDVGLLHAGWYTGYWVQADPVRPAGMAFVQLVRLSEDGPYGHAACSDCPSWDEVRRVARRNPGSLWFIGNEPDRQDLVYADRYAELYHEFYTFLKAEDPTCQVAVGGVVQPTPIRLQYLDQILNAYEDRYGAQMPVDVWNIHNYVCPEVTGAGGCGLPPGTDPALAMDYGVQDHDNLSYWTGQVEAMREWMRARGYRDRPLVITEFGILLPEAYGYSESRVRRFMLRTFDWLMEARDASTGYPADDNRLVQAWAWFSLDDAGVLGWEMRSHLFEPTSLELTALGQEFGVYTEPLTSPVPGTVDLQPVTVRRGWGVAGEGDPVTVIVTAEVYNGGASEAREVLVRFKRDGELAGEVTIPAIGPGGMVDVGAVWPGLALGSYEVEVEVDPEGLVVECDSSNNRLTAEMVLEVARIYLPILVQTQ
jgi:hypothetical protein